MSLPVNENGIHTAYYVSSDDKDAVESLSECLFDMLVSYDKPYDKIIVVCIGTDRSTGDSLGPLVGTFLDKRRKIKRICRVLGCLDYPVHAKTLDWHIKMLARENPLVIAIDACIGKTENIGKILIRKGSLKPGSGVKKELPEIGDISIAGVVTFESEFPFLLLNNTRLNGVYRMATVIAEAINKSLLMFMNSKASCSKYEETINR